MPKNAMTTKCHNMDYDDFLWFPKAKKKKKQNAIARTTAVLARFVVGERLSS